MFMPKKPVSVTLEADNLTWLRGRTLSGKGRSLSETLDDVVRAARLGGGPGDARSVVGTVDIALSDPDLQGADADVAAIFDTSARRPVLLRERTPAYGATRKSSRRG